MFFMEMNLHDECKALVDRQWENDVELWISGQVMREFIVQATHPRTLKQPLNMEQVLYEISRVQRLFKIADDTTAVRARLLDLIRQHSVQGKQVHDARAGH
jgi:ABC-type transporter Mla MlaB component